jgi:hypothetical protein
MFSILRPAISTEFIDVDNYCWIEGVLHDDTYALYPYAQESLDIGFSKYGEMIGFNEDTQIGLGLQYPGYESAATVDAPGGTYDQREDSSVDPFCNEYVGVDWWMNGWFIDIKYRTPAGVYREIWAFAMFSDGQQHGGDWIVMPSVEGDSTARPLWQEYPPYANPDSTEYSGIVTPIPDKGGRKTNGECTTEDINIIYNGPRRFIAVTKTTISDVGGGADLVAIYITFVFNKAEKNVILLKDVKRLYTKQPMNIQFGNRGEWDLGIEGSYDSYTHWYTDHPVQYWDETLNGVISEQELTDTFEFFKDYMLTYKHPKKWWDDVADSQIPSTVWNEWTETSGDFPSTWLETQYTSYNRDWHMDKNIKDHSYAVCQIITEAGDYVGALGVWPHPEFWSASNVFYPPTRTVSPTGNNPSSIPLMLAPISRMLEWHKWTVDEDPYQTGEDEGIENRDDIWVKADDIRTSAGTTLEPIIPFVIYEHDFELSSTLPEYRMVSVYIVTDYHDADDADADDPGNAEPWSSGMDIIDREVQYQLDEIFESWDIYDAMHKNQKRWVQFFDRDYGDHAWDGENYYCIQLDEYREVESGDLIPSLPVYRGGDWDAYCVFSERVLVDTGTGYELIRPYEVRDLDPIYMEDSERPYYTIDLTTGMICFYEWDSDLDTYVPWYLPIGSIVKVLWSSEHDADTAEVWDEDTEIYPVNNDTYIFPLLHDVMPKYKPYTEVFLVEQGETRLSTTVVTDGTAYYSASGTTFTVYNATKCLEIEIKYWDGPPAPDTWYYEKFHSNGSETQVFTLENDADYVKKVWTHSEKALLGGDYVYNNATMKVYMQDSVADGEWLIINYTTPAGVAYTDFRLGDGVKRVFTLTAYPAVGTLVIYNTEILEEVDEEGEGGYLSGYWAVPKEDSYYRDQGTYTYEAATNIVLGGMEEWEWLSVTDTKVRGNWIIQEAPTGNHFPTCDQLVMDQAPLNATQTAAGWPGQELKIVFKVPSGRWEWSIVGEPAASVDTLGNTMVVAAFKNKLIEYGIGGLDRLDATFGPMVPSVIREGISPDSDGRYHLHDDWCYSRTDDSAGMDKSWPIASSNIITVGGPSPNKVSTYFNEYAQAMVYTTVGDGFYAVTCWDNPITDWKFYAGTAVTDRYGYAVISTYKDKNGTVGLMVYGWNGQDTYFAAKWFDEHKFELQHINTHVTDIILEIEYEYSDGDPRCPPVVDIVEKLGTISEKPQHDP